MSNISTETAERRVCPMSITVGAGSNCLTVQCMAWRKMVRVKEDGTKTLDPNYGRCGMVQDYCDHEITLCPTRS
jgi:hypothetical protein